MALQVGVPLLPIGSVSQLLRVPHLLIPVFGSNFRQNYVCMIRVDVRDWRCDYFAFILTCCFCGNDCPAVESASTRRITYIGDRCGLSRGRNT